MKSFRTLRGFIEGHETDEPAYFGYSAALRVFGDPLDLAEITRAMGLQPTELHRKGDRKGPRSPPYKHDMWTLSSGLSEERPLAEHIDKLWETIRYREAYLRQLKSVANVDIFLGYRSNVDTAGIEVPYTSLEMFVRLEVPFGVSIIIA